MRAFVFLLVVLLVVALAGCQGGGDVIPVSYEGSDALVVEFMKDAPADKYYYGDPLSVGLYLENKGAQDIVGGRVKVWDADGIKMDNKVQDFSLDGMRSTRTGEGKYGPVAPVLFEGTAQKEGESVVGITACYNYKTVATAAVCFEMPEYLKAGEVSMHACNAGKVGQTTQGAPVAVTGIETRKGSGTVTVYLSIVSKKPGEKIVGYGFLDLDRCDVRQEDHVSGVIAKVFNAVKPTVKVGDSLLKCPSQFTIGESDNENVVTCSGFSSQFGGAVLRPVEVVLEYGVLQDMSKNIKVELNLVDGEKAKSGRFAVMPE